MKESSNNTSKTTKVYDRLFQDHQKRQKSRVRPYLLDISPANALGSNQSTITPSNQSKTLNQSIDRPKTSQISRPSTSTQRSKSRKDIGPIQRQPTSKAQQNIPLNQSVSNFQNKLNDTIVSNINSSRSQITTKASGNTNQSNGKYSNRLVQESPSKSSQNSYNNQSNSNTPNAQQQDLNNTSLHDSLMNSSSLDNSKVENRLIHYAKVYESRRSKQVEVKAIKEREPSKDKPDINASSSSVIEAKKQHIFEQVFKTINSNTDASALSQGQVSQFVDPATANYRNLPIQVMDILMDVFVEFEEGQRPWNQEKFIQMCNEAYTKIPPGDRSELLKLYNVKAQQKEKERQSQQKSRNNSRNRNKRKKEQLKEEIEKERFKDCTFKPQSIAADIAKLRQSRISNNQRNISPSKSTQNTSFR
eukprot:403358714